MTQKEASQRSEGFLYLYYRLRYSWAILEGFLWDSWGIPGDSQRIQVDFLGAS